MIKTMPLAEARKRFTFLPEELEREGRPFDNAFNSVILLNKPCFHD